MRVAVKWVAGVCFGVALLVGIANSASAQGVYVPNVFSKVIVPAGGLVCLNGSACTSYIQQRTAGYVWIDSQAGAATIYVNAATLQEPSGNWRLTAASGLLTQKAGDTSGTPGNATVNLTAAGQAAIAGGASAVTITSNVTTATSRVFAVLQAADATCTYVKNVIPGSGSFTINVNAACTGATKVAWNIFN